MKRALKDSSIRVDWSLLSSLFLFLKEDGESINYVFDSSFHSNVFSDYTFITQKAII